MGRLFDAVSSLIGVCHQATYEGQPAIELEAIADPSETGGYPFSTLDNRILIGPMLAGVVEDWQSGVAPYTVAAKFHNTIASMAVEVSQRIRTQTGLTTVALSGGVWQNRLLLHKTEAGLQKAGFQTLIHRRVPANDGGVSLGQALVAAWQTR
jgi:hydrogenase maturation protein HypF